MTSGEGCRLCGGAVTFRFHATIMASRRIGYFECSSCGSLQTENPTWLDQAYSLHLGLLDCGAVQRNLDNAAACLLVARLWSLRDALDYGGGDGMLTRLLRDYGVNCFVSDKYAAPTYAQAFQRPDFSRVEMLSSFEVFEHFADPARQFDELFAMAPTLLLASTGLYSGQGERWPYLSLNSGRHVFFYSTAAIQIIARKYGYSARLAGPYILFLRDGTAMGWRMLLFTLFARHRSLRMLRSFLLSRRAWGSLRDVQRLTAMASAGDGGV